jgi:hypothetical protein
MTPAFLITIDTEGDNLWAKPRRIETRNSRFLPRFQALAERHAFKPTYLTNYEMACCPVFREFARDALRRGTAEIGMHLHAWNSPPLTPLTSDDFGCLPYLIEYPETVLREKVAYLTALLEDTFGVDMRSHRAGRWAFNAVYARALIDQGYAVDCSVTPLVSWRSHRGDPAGAGGSDYRDFPAGPYYLDSNDIGRPGASPLLEAPMTIASLQSPLIRRAQSLFPERSLPARAIGRFYPAVSWFRPNGANRGEMRRLIERERARRAPYLEFMLHSSEFMPGGSPTFPTEASIERLYDDLEACFAAARPYFQGATLAEFAAGWPRPA